MKIFVLILAAICGYLIGGWNPAIEVSKRIYHKDIRTCGSGNPGFTNFKRTFGNKWAWWVFALDLTKAAIAVAIFSIIYWKLGGDFQFAAAFTGFFAMAGHAFPIWYRFKGGKGFLVYMSIIWFIDWRAGLIAFGILTLLLLTTKYMSLSTMCAVASTVVFLIATGSASIWVIILCSIQVIFIIVRHKENIVRLCKGTESKFKFK